MAARQAAAAEERAAAAEEEAAALRAELAARPTQVRRVQRCRGGCGCGC